ncbi:hypothetical protein [Methylobacterium sp. CM6247]
MSETNKAESDSSNKQALSHAQNWLVASLQYRLIDDPQGKRPLEERCDWFPDKLCRDAAKEIIRLANENSKLRAELAKATETWTDEKGGVWSPVPAWSYFAACYKLRIERDAALARCEAGIVTPSAG